MFLPKIIQQPTCKDLSSSKNPVLLRNFSVQVTVFVSKRNAGWSNQSYSSIQMNQSYSSIQMKMLGHTLACKEVRALILWRCSCLTTNHAKKHTNDCPKKE